MVKSRQSDIKSQSSGSITKIGFTQLNSVHFLFTVELAGEKPFPVVQNCMNFKM